MHSRTGAGVNEERPGVHNLRRQFLALGRLLLKLFIYFANQSVDINYFSNCCMVICLMHRLHQLLVMLKPLYTVTIVK